ncbi:diguanylate cyclase [Aquisalimonas sp. 2447]|uniref:diguanylate cyclase n=1 Tax=Aquisalimonas sp. 2447 TaxID=2740807 RepID=UPI001432639A|nr:diguanylate cyclase [Aquisalimonas sp. 2447]QIT55272.1 diguanylate cyclase [Aquisalimonas sp. 2447]
MDQEFHQHLAVLLVEDTPRDAQFVTDLLQDVEDTAFAVTRCRRVQEALERVRTESFDVVLLDLGPPDSDVLDVVRQFRDGGGARLPLVVMTGQRRRGLGQEVLQLGAQDYLPKDDLAPAMLERVLLYAVERHRTQRRLELLSAAFNSGQGVFITDNRPRIIEVNRAFTEITGYHAEEVVGCNPRVLSSGHHDEVFYQALWERVHRDGQWAGEIWNRRRDGEIYPQWESISAVSDVSGEETHYVSVFHDISEQKRLETELERLASRDRLTNAYNRHRFYEYLDQAMIVYKRHGTSFALVMFDLDHFKHVNDRWGHPVGDAVLREVVHRCNATLRDTDFLSRWGGEEFLVLANHADEDAAAVLAERLREVVAATPFPTVGPVTISAGVVVVHPEERIEKLQERVDRALYTAKAAGRNCVRLATD